MRYNILITQNKRRKQYKLRKFYDIMISLTCLISHNNFITKIVLQFHSTGEREFRFLPHNFLYLLDTNASCKYIQIN